MSTPLVHPTRQLVAELQKRLADPAALLEEISAVQLLDELLDRLGNPDDARRTASWSVAELLRRAEDHDNAPHLKL